MKKKQILALILAGLMALTACGGGEKKEDKAQTEAPAAGATEEAGEATGEPLIMATEAGFAPYEFIGEGGAIVGIDVDIANEIAKDLGRPLEIKNMSFDGALMEVAGGKADFVAAGVSVTPERQESMDFSINYVDSTEVVVVNAETRRVEAPTYEALNGKIVGVQKGNVADIAVSDTENVQPKEIKRYDKFSQAAEDLRNDKIDAIVMDEQPAKELIAQNGDKLVILEGDPLFVDQYAIGVQKGNVEMQEAINKTIERLKSSGELDAIIAKYAK